MPPVMIQLRELSIALMGLSHMVKGLSYCTAPTKPCIYNNTTTIPLFTSNVELDHSSIRVLEIQLETTRAKKLNENY